MWYAPTEARYILKGEVHMARRMSKEYRAIKEAGVTIHDASSLYHPGGWPGLGLSPLATTLSARSAPLLTRQLEASEHKRGNTFFRALGLGRLDIRLANELASVYSGLAERYPGVRVDLINFSTSIEEFGPKLEGVTFRFQDNFPTIHAAAELMGTGDIRELYDLWSDEEFDSATSARMERELGYYSVNGLSRRDATAHASIFITECFSHPTCYAIFSARAEERNLRRAMRGEPASSLETRISEASQLLTHEFGHAVEYALKSKGEVAWGRVLRVLEDCTLRDDNGTWSIKDSALRREGLSRRDVRLINYQYVNEVTVPGDGARRRAVKRLMRSATWPLLGLYAHSFREEIFAEAFLAAHASTSPELVRRLAPFREALYEAGISVKRRYAGTR
jgi:hypothetical protein